MKPSQIPSIKPSSAGNKFRQLANKLNKDNHLDKVGVALLACGVATWALFADTYPAPDGGKREIPTIDHSPPGTDKFQNWNQAKGRVYIDLKFAEDVPAEYAHIYRTIKSYLLEQNASARIMIHEIHEEVEDPYIIATLEGKNYFLPILAIPKAILREEKNEVTKKNSWEVIKETPLESVEWKFKRLIPSAPEKRVEKLALPIERTLTNKEGKSIEATVHKISEGKVTLTPKGGAKKVQIAFATLSDEDQTFFKEKVNINLKRILLITRDDKGIEDLTVMNHKDFVITPVSVGERPFITQLFKNPVNLPSLAPTEELKKLVEAHDAVWVRTPDKHVGEFAQMLADMNKPAAIYYYKKVQSLEGFVKEAKEPKEEFDKKGSERDFLERIGNIIFFRETIAEPIGDDEMPKFQTIKIQVTEDAVKELKALMR